MIDAAKFDSHLKRALGTVYAEPDESYHKHLIPQMAAQYFAPLELPKDAFILDVGCGPGTFIKLLEADGYSNVFGVTMSEEEFASCADLTVTLADMADIPLGDATFDFLWCRHALEHSPCPLFALYEFERLLKPGARLFIEVPAPDCQRRHEDNANHYSIMGVRMWHSLIHKAGLTPLQIAQFSCDIHEKEQPHTRWRELSYIIEAVKPVKVDRAAAQG